MKTLASHLKRTFTIALPLLFIAWNAQGQTTRFNYSGNLNDNGAPANGTYDFQFALYDVATGGTPGGTQPINGVQVTGGQFSVTLDFGLTVFFHGGPRYLEVSARPTGGGAYTALPRTQILAAPYAVAAQTLVAPALLHTFSELPDYALAIDSSDGQHAFLVNPIGLVIAHSYALTDSPDFFVSKNGDVAAKSFSTSNFVVGTLGNISGHSLTLSGTMDATSLTLTGDLNVSGNKHALVSLPSGKSVYMSAVESPETWFEDFGTAKLSHGSTWVAIDRRFSDTANLNAGYHVFLTPSGNSRGLYVSKRTNSGFEVRETGGGHSSIEFDYRVVGRRRGYENERFKEASPVAQNK